MTLRSHVKQNARRALDGSWGRAIGILLICVTIYLIFGLLRGMTALLAGIPEFQDLFGTPELFLDDMPSLTAASLVMEAGFLLVQLVVNAPLSLGMRGWYYELGGGRPDDISAIFSFFGSGRLFFRALWLRINLWICSGFWCVLFGAIPAAVFAAAWVTPSYETELLLALLSFLLAVPAGVFCSITLNRYFLAPYLLGQYPDMKARQAIRSSVREMKGGKTEIFLLQVSFLPWVLLCVFLLPLLYVGPYIGCSQALYARYFIERARRAGTLPGPLEAPVEGTAPTGESLAKPELFIQKDAPSNQDT